MSIRSLPVPQLLQLLELLGEFVAACGESRKLIPHAATWRGQTLQLSVELDAPPKGEGFGQTPGSGGGIVPPSMAAVGGSGGGSGTGWNAAAPTFRGGLVGAVSAAVTAPTHRRAGSSGAGSQGGGVAAGSAAAGGVGACVGGGSMVGGGSTGGGAPSGAEGGSGDGEGGGRRLQLSVHDNLTLGLLRHTLKREMVAVGLPRSSYRNMQLLRNGVLLEGETRTLRELGIGDEVPLTLRLLRAKEVGGPISKEAREAKFERLSSLPGYMIATSSNYMEILFELLKAFGRTPSIVVQTWELLMRVPTYAQRQSALNRPDLVSWTAELSNREHEPMRVLYMMQARVSSATVGSALRAASQQVVP